MNRGDILAKMQSTASAAETRTLSITDAAIQNKSDASNALNAFDAQSVFKLISSASDLDQRFDSDKECDSIKNEASQLAQFDMHATTKNKRKNFKPRNATAAVDAAVSAATVATTEPSFTDQLILNLMMQNKMKQLQQELHHQGQFKRWNQNDDGKVDQQMTGTDSDRSTTSNNNESCNSLKSPPSSPFENGHGASGGKKKCIEIS